MQAVCSFLSVVSGKMPGHGEVCILSWGQRVLTIHRAERAEQLTDPLASARYTFISTTTGPPTTAG